MSEDLREEGEILATTLGYQGWGNVGDEAILAGIEALLLGSPIRIHAVFCGPEPVAAFAGVERVVIGRGLPSWPAIRVLSRSDCLVLSGGGLVHDHWMSVIPRYLGWSLAARAVGARVLWIGVGVGPIRKILSRRLAALLIRLADFASVRDGASADLVELVVPGTPVTVIPDPAIFIEPPTVGERAGTGWIVRPPIRTDPRVRAGIAEAVAEAMMRHSLEGGATAQAIITLAGTRDDAYAAEVADVAHKAGLSNLEVLRLSPDPSEALKTLARYRSLISMRLHGFLFAALLNVPCVPIAYDEKVRAAALELGADELVVDLGDLSADRIASALRRASDDDMRKAIAGRVAELRSRRREIQDVIVTAALGAHGQA